MKSTSIHSLNADTGLNFIEKPLYLFLNWVNNLFPYTNVDKNIKLEPFKALNWKERWDSTYPSSSAARKSSDLFWQTLPWQKIKEELGGIHIFDTGCGRGH